VVEGSEDCDYANYLRVDPGLRLALRKEHDGRAGQSALCRVMRPACGSENVKFNLSIANIVAWAGKLLGVPTVKIYEKKCAECGVE
jgi:hypothetical protein